MTGAGFRAMKFTKTMLAAAILISTTATEVISATITINVAFTAPTCNVTVDPTYNLGILVVGEAEKPHRPMPVKWDCQGGTGGTGKSFLTARVTNGLADPSKESVELLSKSGAKSGSGVFLSLRAKNAPVKIDGTTAICEQTGPQGQCDLTPVTKVPTGSVQLGGVEGALVFEAKYS